MWQCTVSACQRGQHYTVFSDDQPLTYREALAAWQDNSAFREFFLGLLRDSEFTAYRWETPHVTEETIDRDFEFVLLRADALARPVDASAFRARFQDNQSVVAFPNLSGDAMMVVPCPVASQNIYGHLASFVRQAPDEQAHQLWRVVSTAMLERLSSQPVWLSTAGMGVSWLHVRLDSRPKYYGHQAYRHS